MMYLMQVKPLLHLLPACLRAVGMGQNTDEENAGCFLIFNGFELEKSKIQLFILLSYSSTQEIHDGTDIKIQTLTKKKTYLQYYTVSTVIPKKENSVSDCQNMNVMNINCKDFFCYQVENVICCSASNA